MREARILTWYGPRNAVLLTLHIRLASKTDSRTTNRPPFSADKRITRSRGVSDPSRRAGRGSTRVGGVVHATVPLPSQPEPLSGAAENAAPSEQSCQREVVAAQAHSRTTDAAIPVSRQLFGDRERRRRRGLRLRRGCVPLLDPLWRRTDEGR